MVRAIRTIFPLSGGRYAAKTRGVQPEPSPLLLRLRNLSHFAPPASMHYSANRSPRDIRGARSCRPTRICLPSKVLRRPAPAETCAMSNRADQVCSRRRARTGDAPAAHGRCTDDDAKGLEVSPCCLRHDLLVQRQIGCRAACHRRACAIDKTFVALRQSGAPPPLSSSLSLQNFNLPKL